MQTCSTGRDLHLRLDRLVAARKSLILPRLRLVASAHPEFFDLMIALGDLLIEIGSLDEAESLITGILERQPGEVEALELLAKCRQKAGDSGGQLEALQQAVRYAVHHGQISRVARVFVGLGLGEIAIDCDEVDDGLAAFTRAIELEPDKSWGYSRLAEKLSELGMEEEAKK